MLHLTWQPAFCGDSLTFSFIVRNRISRQNWYIFFKTQTVFIHRLRFVEAKVTAFDQYVVFLAMAVCELRFYLFSSIRQASMKRHILWIKDVNSGWRVWLRMFYSLSRMLVDETFAVDLQTDERECCQLSHPQSVLKQGFFALTITDMRWRTHDQTTSHSTGADFLKVEKRCEIDNTCNWLEELKHLICDNSLEHQPIYDAHLVTG